MTRFGLATAMTMVLLLGNGAPSAEESAAVQAPAALGPFKQALKKALVEGMSRGPVEAVGACNLQAPGIAVAHSDDGTKVGRSSHRLRNPDNAPPDWVKPVLSVWVAEPSERIPRRVELAGGESGYIEPIFMQPLCATCHGKAIAPDVAARIGDLYPDDKAVGFEVGDLRGVWWVESPASQ